MRILKILVILSLFFTIGLVVDSCNPCKCDSPATYEYSISSLNLHNIDNSGKYPIIEVKGQAINKNAYGIMMSFDTEGIYAIRALTYPFFIQSVYACECIEDIFIPKDSIIALKIFSEQDFWESFSAGTDISSFFRVLDYDSKSGSPTLTPFADYLNRPAQVMYGSSDIVLTCLLMDVPIHAGEYTFRVVARLSDQREITQVITTTLK